MLKRRIIPCLDVAAGRVVKGVRFANLRDAGDPVALAAHYAKTGADELVMLDVTATQEARGTTLETVQAMRAVLDIPLTVGGGVQSVAAAAALLQAGADKVSVNSAAVQNPALLTELANRFGRQCTVLAIDVTRRAHGSWEVLTRAGQHATGLDALVWAKQAVALGAGEILLTSLDRDGTGEGYDLALLKAMSAAVRVPIIASGGARTWQDLQAALQAGADAVLAATIFHDGHTTPQAIKQPLAAAGVPVRLTPAA